MRPEIRREIIKAKEWLRVTRDLRWAADAQLRAGGEFHEIAQKRAALRSAEARAAAAFEDLRGWESLARRIR